MIPYLLAWLPMLILAIGNGILREAVIKKSFGEAAAHQLSTVSLLMILTLYIQWILRLYPPASMQTAWLVGVLWMLLTITFEFGLGLSRGMTWPVMLADYNLLRGKLWALVPLWMLAAPFFFFMLRS